jgi:hypothetical protein
MELLRALAVVGADASWVVCFIAAVIAVFVVYLGIAMYATLRASDLEQQKIRYKVFQDLLKLFTRGRQR